MPEKHLEPRDLSPDLFRMRGSRDRGSRLKGVRVLALFGAIPMHGQERGNIEVFCQIKHLGGLVRVVTHASWGHLHVQPELDRQQIEWATAPFGPLIGRALTGRDLLRILRGLVVTNWVLWREVRRWRPTHLYAMNWLYLLYASPLVFLIRLPLVYRLGDVPPTHTPIHRWFWRKVCSRSSFVVCISRFIRDQVSSSGCVPARIKVIHHFPPRRLPENAPSFPHTVPGATRLLYVGQIAEGKGVPLLVQAVRILLSREQNVVLWLAGDHAWRNPMAQSLIAEVDRDGLAHRIIFLGYVSNVPGLMRSADIHVCPSLVAEGLGNVVLEAKAQGLASIAFPSGGLPELIDHKIDGYLCSDKTADALAEGIAYYLDVEKRKAAGLAARRSLSERFGEERFQREWAQVFIDTLR